MSPDYAKNAAKSLAKFPATSLDAKRIKAVQVRLLGHTAHPCITSSMTYQQAFLHVV